MQPLLSNHTRAFQQLHQLFLVMLGPGKAQNGFPAVLIYSIHLYVDLHWHHIKKQQEAKESTHWKLRFNEATFRPLRSLLSQHPCVRKTGDIYKGNDSSNEIKILSQTHFPHAQSQYCTYVCHCTCVKKCIYTVSMYLYPAYAISKP